MAGTHTPCCCGVARLGIIGAAVVMGPRFRGDDTEYEAASRPENDVVAVLRWIDGRSTDGFVKRLLAAVK